MLRQSQKVRDGSEMVIEALRVLQPRGAICLLLIGWYLWSANHSVADVQSTCSSTSQWPVRFTADAACSSFQWK